MVTPGYARAHTGTPGHASGEGKGKEGKEKRIDDDVRVRAMISMKIEKAALEPAQNWQTSPNLSRPNRPNLGRIG